MEKEIRNADLSDIMCDLLYLLGCGVNGKMPAKTYIKTFQKVYDEDKMQMLYQFSKVHFVDALTGTVLKNAGIKILPVWEQSIAKAIRKVILFDQERAEIFGGAGHLAYATKRRDIKGVLSVYWNAADVGQ